MQHLIPVQALFIVNTVKFGTGLTELQDLTNSIRKAVFNGITVVGCGGSAKDEDERCMLLYWCIILQVLQDFEFAQEIKGAIVFFEK